MADATKVLQTGGDAGDGSSYPTPVIITDTQGNPVDFGGGSSAPAAGSVTPASLGGYDAGTGHGKVVQVKADGSGFDFVAPVTAPTADTLSGATAIGKGVLKAADAAAARAAIGAGTSSFSGSYGDLANKPTIPAAPTWATISGRPTAAAAIPDLAADADGATIVATVNKLLAAARGFGIIAS